MNKSEMINLVQKIGKVKIEHALKMFKGVDTTCFGYDKVLLEKAIKAYDKEQQKNNNFLVEKSKQHINILSQKGKKYEEYVEWIEKNQDFYELFDKFTKQALVNKSKISAWLIVNRIRWEIEIETNGDEYKINNDFIAYLARDWMVKNNNMGAFTLKKMKS